MISNFVPSLTQIGDLLGAHGAVTRFMAILAEDNAYAELAPQHWLGLVKPKATERPVLGYLWQAILNGCRI